ncbi:branched-chain amino acid ABC transporter substrate-binding protein [Aeromicrobium camelliae]|uniref:Branched-chain amino acid ABC transporter substrate-binding protein n=1 Tax=Aeromicrobium camelliae TaxID=1538144 RepID=A0A3N6ZLI5_9ACTN|nr:branched-chain amino acid ABC transporter substrate-binding protein [Aeromicrobium camelliae]RQN07877.1 branched-chain amino acid ABC transporter substrate-binding protein [Aeromicrobium camelliae]
MTSIRSTRGWQRARFAAVSAAVATVLAGCAGGVGGSGDDASGDTLKFGLLAPFSGSESAFGEYMKNGAQMAVDEINADGGIDGKEIELVTEDDACDATTAVSAANKLVSQGIVASVGGYCSGATLPTLPIFLQAEVPMVIPAANSNALPESDQENVFLINGTGTQQAEAAVKFAQKEGATKVAVIDDSTDYSVDLADSFAEQASEAGLEIVEDATVTPKEKDYAAEANKIVGSGADFVYWTGYYQEGALINRQAKDAGYEGTFLVGDGSVDASFAEITGEGYTENVYGTFTQTPDMLEGAGDWIAEYKEKFGAEPGPYSTQSYDAVRVAAEAIKEAGTTDMAEVVDALHGLDGFETFAGPLTFTDQGTREQGGFAIVTIGDDGTFVLHDDLLDD